MQVCEGGAVDRNAFISHFNKQTWRGIMQTKELEAALGAAESRTNQGTYFTSRQPRLAKLGALRSGITANGHFPGSDFMQALTPRAKEPPGGLLIREPGRNSACFLTSPRMQQGATLSKRELRDEVLMGLPPTIR
uniref:Uncharacterized protein n=1 Tax=Coccolithus braarudii TaxID=221442 RepID=A0A7S0LQJ2_9EUKA|mmetsp:Transcript_53037/g.113367  ORF Transcript_53037/g.113367 Transcript_53037/m.113367 type:complete len:135 (+) Transcript_53037:27-431(+)